MASNRHGVSFTRPDLGPQVIALAIFSCMPCVAAEPARFWLSLSDSHPYVTDLGQPPGLAPGVPSIEVAVGFQRELHVWGRPQSVSGVLKKLQNLSIDVAPPVGQLFDTFGVVQGHLENPEGSVGDPNRRYEQLIDSANEFVIAPGTPVEQTLPAASDSGFRGVQAFSLLQPTSDVGIGPDCALSVLCYEPPAGDAWLIGSITVEGYQPGADGLHLQIGEAGMNHVSIDGQTIEPPGETRIAFGVDNIEYNPGLVDSQNLPTERQMTKPLDTPDAIVTAFDPSPGDYNGDGVVNAADYTVYRDTFGSTTDLRADGDGDGQIDPDDLGVYQLGYGLALTPGISTTAPEPSTWILALLAVPFITERSSRR